MGYLILLIFSIVRLFLLVGVLLYCPLVVVVDLLFLLILVHDLVLLVHVLLIFLLTGQVNLACYCPVLKRVHMRVRKRTYSSLFGRSGMSREARSPAGKIAVFFSSGATASCDFSLPLGK